MCDNTVHHRYSHTVLVLGYKCGVDNHCHMATWIEVLYKDYLCNWRAHAVPATLPDGFRGLSRCFGDSWPGETA